MNKKTLVLGLLAAGTIAAAQAAPVVPAFAQKFIKTAVPAKTLLSEGNTAKKPARVGATRATRAEIMRPEAASFYKWSTETNAWALDSKATYLYNAEGYVLTETKENERTVYTYDPIVTNYVAKEEYQVLDEGVWSTVEGTEMIVTRNADNKVTELAVRQFQNGTWGDTQKLYTVTYGSDGKADGLTIYGEENAVYMTVKNAKWVATDNQILIDLSGEFMGDSFCVGNNRLASATLTSPENAMMIISLTATYPDDKGSYACKMSLMGFTMLSEEKTITDTNGSFKLVQTQPTDGGGSVTSTYVYEYDQFGLPLKLRQDATDGAQAIWGELRGTVTYGSDSYPTSIETKACNYDAPDTWINQERIEFGKYTNTAAVADIDNQNAPAEYFNLQGVKVANPAAGIYIRKEGSSVKKVMVK